MSTESRRLSRRLPAADGDANLPVGLRPEGECNTDGAPVGDISSFAPCGPRPRKLAFPPELTQLFVCQALIESDFRSSPGCRVHNAEAASAALFDQLDFTAQN